MIEVDGTELRAGNRVLLRPRAGGDIMDLALADRTAVVESIEEGVDGEVQLAVTVEDDPGRDLGERRQPGHRFFFSPEEVRPLEPATAPAGPRVLVAGIGNIFLGDDGFGVALAGRLATRELPAGVEVVDFGIRGMDLAWAMQDGYDAVVMLDAGPARRGARDAVRDRARARRHRARAGDARDGPGASAGARPARWTGSRRARWWSAASRRRCSAPTTRTWSRT